MTPTPPIPYSDAIAAHVQAVINLAELAERDIDEEHYSDLATDGLPRPKVHAALAVKSRSFSRVQAAGFNLLRSVCGSDQHPLCREWVTFVHSPVVDSMRRAAGILEGFLDSWKAGALWPSDDRDGPTVTTAAPGPEAFGTPGVDVSGKVGA